MAGKRVGYKRVSTEDQSTARQLVGVELDKVFEDVASGKNTDRPQLAAMLSYLREEDTLLVHSLDRLGRSLVDLWRLVDDLVGRGVTVQFVKEGLTFAPGDSKEAPFARLMFNILGAFAQFEREITKERQREGIALAKKANKYKGRKPVLDANLIEAARQRISLGVSKAKVARDLGVGRSTLYQYLSDTPKPAPKDTDKSTT